MSGELRIVRNALRVGALSAVPVACVAFALRGPNGGWSALIASAIVLSNVALSAGISAAAGALNFQSAAMMALPSFTFRMLAISVAFALLQDRSFIDTPVFIGTFVTGVIAMLFLEARALRTTPWLALTFDVEERS